MKHPTEEQLVAYRYGDAEDRAALEQHFGECEECRASLQALEQVLAAIDAAPVPERDAAYGRRVWQQIKGRLDEQAAPVAERPRTDWRAWLAPRRWIPAAAMAALVLAAFLAGQFWESRHKGNGREIAVQPAEQRPEQIRERILLVAVGDHLDRAQMVLVELTNANATGTGAQGGLDISSEQQRAEDLISANRLYRQTAARTGDAAMASVLDELERVLLEIAHSPSRVSSGQLEEIRQRIESRGILFKVRVVGSDVREREKSPARAAPKGSS